MKKVNNLKNDTDNNSKIKLMVSLLQLILVVIIKIIMGKTHMSINNKDKKKFKFNHTKRWYMHNLAPVLENNTHKVLWDFDIHTDHLIAARKSDLIIINKKKRTFNIVDFAVPADHRINLKECEKKDKYLDLARELKKLWNLQLFIPIVIGAFATVTKGLLKELEDLEEGGRVETIQTATLLRTVRKLRRVLETWGDLMSLKLQ